MGAIFFIPFGYIEGNIKRKIFIIVMDSNLDGKERCTCTVTLNTNQRRRASIRQRKTAFTESSTFANNFW